MTYRTHDVPVRGGTLRVGEWGPADGTPVIAIHGITASHLAWGEVVKSLDGIRLIAPDLRGRGESSTLPGPFGMRQHAEDVLAVLDALGLDRAPIVGHSMGAFVAMVTANLFPDRVSSLLLIDGGLTLDLPAGLTIEDTTKALGPAADRLAMTFPSHEAYREFWKVHPAFADAFTEVVGDYADYDLAGAAPTLRPRTSVEAMQEDSLELYGGAEVVASIDHLAHPATLLWAPRGLQNQSPGLYSPATIERWAARLPQLAIELVPHTNHYTIVMGARGAEVVAGHIRTLK